MSTINERLQILVNERCNGNVREFERMCELKKDTLKNILGVRASKPSFETLEFIFRILDRETILWLVTDEKYENDYSFNPDNVKLVDNNFLLDRIEKLVIENHELRKENEQLKNIKQPTVNITPYTEDTPAVSVAAEPEKKF